MVRTFSLLYPKFVLGAQTLCTMTECCMSGCAICVQDIYQESLDAYNESISSLRASLFALRVPEAEWPTDIQTNAANGEGERKGISNVSLDAFVEMERALELKKKEGVMSELSS